MRYWWLRSSWQTVSIKPGRKESVLIKKRHEKKTKRKKQVYKRIKMMIVIIIEKTLLKIVCLKIKKGIPIIAEYKEFVRITDSIKHNRDYGKLIRDI